MGKIQIGLICLIGFICSNCYADFNDYLDYLGKERDHFGVKTENALGANEKFFIGGDINDLGTSVKVLAEKKDFLAPAITLGIEASEAFLDDRRYRQKTPAEAVYIYYDLSEDTRFSGEMHCSQPEIYHLHETTDGRIARYAGVNKVNTLLLRCENAPTDNDDYPTSGRKTDVSLEVSSDALGSDFNFLRTTIGNAFYYTPLKLESPFNKLTLVFIQQAGCMRRTSGDDEIPFFERLYAGGTTTVRGYKPRYLGPRDSEDEPIGGNAMASWTLEARYPVWKDIKAAVFYDQGNAWKKSGDFDLSDTSAGVGAGLRWVMRFGTCRLDYGYGLDDDARQRGGRLHASLGMRF
jgi:outer membrane protein assembly factor BamA